MHLTERPLTQKVNIGDEPISNTIWGMNTNYSNNAPYLTRLMDALPLIETKEKSQLQFRGEFAQLIPGSPRGIRITGSETTYLDDFESSQTTIDLRSLNSWNLASTPGNQNSLFPESALNNDLAIAIIGQASLGISLTPLYIQEVALYRKILETILKSLPISAHEKC